MEKKIVKELRKYLDEEEEKYIENNKELIEKICNIERIIIMNNLLNI